jgi:hypothetical protein
MSSLASYNEIRSKYNPRVSKDLQLPEQAPEGTHTLVDSHPITITMTIENQNVKQITIHCAQDGSRKWDETFLGFEEGMNWVSMNFYNAYQKAVKERTTAVGRAHGITATHVSPKPNDLSVTLERI